MYLGILTTNSFAYRSVLVEFYSIPRVTTAGDSPNEVTSSLFVYQGCPRAVQWMVDLSTIDLGHVQLDGFQPFYCSRYPISFAGKIICCGTAMHSPTGFSNRLIHWYYSRWNTKWRHNPYFSQSTVKYAQSLRLCSRTCLSYNLLIFLKYIQFKWYKDR